MTHYSEHDSRLRPAGRARLLTPISERPEPPSGERALRAARLREQRARWAKPIPEEVLAPVGGCRGSGGSGARARRPGQLGRPRSVTEAQEARILILRREGRKIRSIAEEVGCTEGAVRHVLATARGET